MNRKTLLIIAIVSVTVVAIVAYLFWRGDTTHTAIDLPKVECLVFQSDDSSLDCYVSPSVPNRPNTATKPVIITTPAQTGTTSIAVAMPTGCDVSDNTFERNDCVAKTAVSTKNSSLCTLVSGSLAQSACVRDVGVTTSISAPVQNQSYEAFLRATSSVIPTSIQTTVVSSPATFTTPTASKTDSRTTTEGLIERFKSLSPSLFSISPYQVRPGGAVTLQGVGFGDSNDIHVGGYLVSTSSTDGITLSFSAPASIGEHEVWVTNSGGSTAISGRTTKLIVTENPAPLPVITSVTPNPANYGDIITISGTGFSNTNIVATSLGIMENVSSSGNAISVRLSDFSLASMIRSIPYMKDRRTAILMYIQSEGGLSQKAYSFDVQF